MGVLRELLQTAQIRVTVFLHPHTVQLEILSGENFHKFHILLSLVKIFTCEFFSPVLTIACTEDMVMFTILILLEK